MVGGGWWVVGWWAVVFASESFAIFHVTMDNNNSMGNNMNIIITIEIVNHDFQFRAQFCL